MSEFSPPTMIDAAHDISKFDCGKAPLNEFLSLHAVDKQNARLSRTYVVLRTDFVVAYYTLAHVSVTQPESPKKFGSGMPAAIPAIRMARLAIDLTAQGLGLGRSLFVDALRRTWIVMERGAAPVRLFVVDAMDDSAKAFYERFDMTPSPVNPMRLFLSYKDIRKVFENS
jgi:hypothetical protein